MRIQDVDIKKVIPYARNPRKNQTAISKVASSIKEFGWQQPIVVDNEMIVIAGHTRLLASQQLGLKKVPIVIAGDLSPSQVKAYRLADNRVAEEAEWDAELLTLELKDLLGEDYNLDLVGFSEEELANLLTEKLEDGLTDPDDIPEEPEEPISVAGDIWLLGKHRLVCGDSTNPLVVEQCFNGVSPNLMVTDPPYGVEYKPEWRAEAGVNKNKNKMGAVLNDDRADWSEAWSLFTGDIAYVWHGGLKSGIVGKSLEDSGFKLRSQIIWSKDRFALSRSDYHWHHEPCWYAVRDKKNGYWKGDRKQSTIWNIKAREDSGRGHGTQKPVECMKRPIENNSSTGQAVYEPFSGSGTTIIACEMTGRSCHAIELSPSYVDVAIKRWQDFTGKKAIHAETKKEFNG